MNQTPIHFPVIKNLREIFLMLIEEGADINVNNNKENYIKIREIYFIMQ